MTQIEKLKKLRAENYKKLLHPNNDIQATIIHETFKNIQAGMSNQKAFLEACENSNLHGDNVKIKAIRKSIANTLGRQHSIRVTTVKGF